MKRAYWLWLIPGLAFLASAQLLSPPMNQPTLNDYQVLADSVSVLQTKDPALAAKLKQVASKPVGLPSQATPPDDVQTIRAAAVEVGSSRPDLSAKLNDYAYRQPK